MPNLIFITNNLELFVDTFWNINFWWQIIVLEDTKQYISYASRKEIEMQDRRSFDLLVSWSLGPVVREPSANLSSIILILGRNFPDTGHIEPKAEEEGNKNSTFLWRMS